MRRTSAVLVLAVGLLSTACASTETGTATAEAGSPGSPGSSAAASGAASTSASADTPSGDLSAFALTAGVDLSTAGIAVATDPATSTSLVAAVTPISVPLDQLDSLVQGCSTFTVTLPGAGSAEASITELPDPQVDADAARALSTTVTLQLGGSSTAVTTVVYVAEVRGLQVSVGASGVSGSPVDPSVLDGLLTTAVAEVAAG